MHSKLLLIAATIAPIVSACGTTGTQSIPPFAHANSSGEAWQNRVGWLPQRPAGAAVLSGGYEHVLSPRPHFRSNDAVMANAAIPKADQERLSNEEKARASVFTQLPAVLDGSGARGDITSPPTSDLLKNVEGQTGHATALSAAQVEAWKRYCVHSPDMTRDDWTIVMNTSGPPYSELDRRLMENCAALRNDWRSPNRHPHK